MALIDVIKYEGNALVWKHVKEDFNTASYLIVHESQEAVVFRNGVASDVYGPGRYVIKTANLPGIRHFVELVTGGVSPNHCEVYFLNKSISMNILWGTATPMLVQDPVWQVPFLVRAFGQMSVRIGGETKNFLSKLIGTTEMFTSENVTAQFRGLLMANLKSYICDQMINQELSFMEINAYLPEISDSVKETIKSVFYKYGLIVEEFYIESVSVEQDEIYKQVREASARRISRKLEGIDYVTERSFDVAEKQAQNQGTSGTMTGLAVGASVGMAAGPMLGGMMNRALQPATSFGAMPVQPTAVNNQDVGVVKPKPRGKSSATTATCVQCGTIIEKSRFCPHCGAKQEEN